MENNLNLIKNKSFVKCECMHSTEELIDYIYAKQREIKLLSEKNLANIKKPRIQFSEIRQYDDTFCESDNE